MRGEEAGIDKQKRKAKVTAEEESKQRNICGRLV